MMLKFHDDDCGFHPDMQSTAFRDVSASELRLIGLPARCRPPVRVGVDDLTRAVCARPRRDSAQVATTDYRDGWDQTFNACGGSA